MGRQAVADSRATPPNPFAERLIGSIRRERPDKLRPSARPKPSRAQRRARGRTCSGAGRSRRSDCPFIRFTASKSRSSVATAATPCVWNSPMANCGSCRRRGPTWSRGRPRWRSGADGSDWRRMRCASSGPGSRPGSAAVGRPKKLDSIAGDARELTLDAAPTDGAAVPHHDGETFTLVEQAGPSRAGRRGVRQKRGRR